MNITLEDIILILETKGDRAYGGEAISQLKHALQCATLAEAKGSKPELIVASLLHDLGHLLSDIDETSENDFHEYKAVSPLKQLFGLAVSEPVRLHVEAKKYLCAVDLNYWKSLSPASKQSLEWQGGGFSQEQAEAFIARPFASQAVQLRHWDDLAKVVDFLTPNLAHFRTYLTTCVKNN